jgi:hypothetical protein
MGCGAISESIQYYHYVCVEYLARACPLAGRLVIQLRRLKGADVAAPSVAPRSCQPRKNDAYL